MKAIIKTCEDQDLILSDESFAFLGFVQIDNHDVEIIELKAAVDSFYDRYMMVLKKDKLIT